MTIQATEPLRSEVYVSTGVETAFPFPFTSFRDGDVGVATQVAGGVWTYLTYGTDYSIVRNAPPLAGGSVRFSAPLPAGVRLLAFADPLPSQERSFSNQSGLFLNEIERALDKLTALVRQIDDRARRSPSTSHIVGQRNLTLDDPLPGRVLIATAAGWENGPSASQISGAQAAAVAAIAAANTAVAAVEAIEEDATNFEQHYLDALADNGVTP